MGLQELSAGVRRLIGSCQIITNIHSVVKELVENSIDAGATSIDVKLEKFGLDKIEVRDNGSGIKESEVRYVCLPHYTSKIHDFEDLEQLQSYGFRGEALYSLCAISDVVITTRTQQDDVAHVYSFDNKGEIFDSKVSHHSRGTTVNVINLFSNVPVRREYCSKSRSYELQKIEKVIKVLAIINTKLRVTLVHNKCLIWQKTESYTIRDSLMQAYPHNMIKNLIDRVHTYEDITVQISLPTRDCNIAALCISSLKEAVLVFINKRPVIDKSIQLFVHKEMLSFYASAIPRNKYPICIISVSMSSKDLDVNVESDKSTVMIVPRKELITCLSEVFSSHFSEQSSLNSSTTKNTQLLTQFFSEKDECDKFVKKFKKDDESSFIPLPSTEQNSIVTVPVDAGRIKRQSDECRRRSENHTSKHNDILMNKVNFVDLDVKENSCKSNSGAGGPELFPEIVELPIIGQQQQKKLTESVGELNNDNISSDRLTVSQWSKGSAVINDKKLQGGTFLLGMVKKNIADHFKYALKDSHCGNESQFKTPTSVKRSVISSSDKMNQDGLGKLKGIVANKHPAAVSFSDVVNGLASKSRSLNNDERNEYVKKKVNSPHLSPKTTSAVKKVQSPKQNTKPVNKIYLCAITARQIEEKIKNTRMSMRVDKKKSVRLLTNAKSSHFKWLCRRGKEISLINVRNLQEVVLYHKNLCTQSLPLHYLEIPVTILESDIDNNLWDLLLLLNRRKSEISGVNEIDDLRLVKNGYGIELCVDAEDCVTEVKIRHIFKPYLGQELVQLKEILFLINKHENLLNCRTFRAAYFISVDTSKLCETLPLTTDDDEVMDLLNYWTDYIETYRGHLSFDKQILVQIHSFS